MQWDVATSIISLARTGTTINVKLKQNLLRDGILVFPTPIFRGYNTMEVLAPEPTVMKTVSSEMNRTRRNANKITSEVLSEYYAEELENGKPRINIQR